MRVKWQHGWGDSPWYVPFLVFFLSMSTTICAWVWAGVIVNASDQERFGHATEEAQQAIQARMDDQVDLLRIMAASFGIAGYWQHDRFRHYVQNLDLTKHYNGMLGVGYAQVTLPEQVPRLESTVRADGVSEFEVHPVTRGPMYPIVFFEPATTRPKLVGGFDLYSNDICRQAMDQAIDSGSPTVSGVQSIGPSRLGTVQQSVFFIFCPVYQGGVVPASTQEKRRLITGLVFSPLRGSGLYQDVLVGEARRFLDIQILDIPPGKMIGNELYVSSRSISRRIPERSADVTQTMLGRQWLIRYATSPVFESESAVWLVNWIFFAGLAVTILLACVSQSQGKSNRQLIAQTLELQQSEAQIRQLNENLEQIVQDRTTELRASNNELEAFCYSVSHDLRAPLRSVDGFSKSLLEDYGDRLDSQGREFINRVRNASQRMDELISALLNLSRITRSEIIQQDIDVTDIANRAIEDALEHHPDQDVDVKVRSGMVATADPRLVRVILDNLVGNAIKFGAKAKPLKIEVGVKGGAFFVKDNGVGFNPAYTHKLFLAFERLHTQLEFPGSGIGLATVQRIVQRHGGRVWAESKVGKGATFYFTLEPE